MLCVHFLAGGIGGLGTVERIERKVTGVWVQWDRGGNNVYRYSRQHGMDLTILGTSSTPYAASAAPSAAAAASTTYRKPPKIGTPVKRSADWKYKDEDGGIGGVGFVTSKQIDDADDSGCVWVRWQRTDQTLVYRFGFEDCYEVELLDAAAVKRYSIKLADKVRRGPDWRQGDEDGGPWVSA